MTAERAGDYVLSADLTGAGRFAAVGYLRAPAIAFAAALKDFQANQADAELRDSLIHAVAAKTAGRCILVNSEMEVALGQCIEANLIAEWRIGIPAIGILQALFRISRLRNVENQTQMFDLALQLAGKPWFRAMQPEQAEIS